MPDNLNCFIYKFHSISISEEYSRFQPLGFSIFYFRKTKREVRLWEENAYRILTAFLITTVIFSWSRKEFLELLKNSILLFFSYLLWRLSKHHRDNKISYGRQIKNWEMPTHQLFLNSYTLRFKTLTAGLFHRPLSTWYLAFNADTILASFPTAQDCKSCKN